MSHAPKKSGNPFGFSFDEIFIKSFVQGFQTAWILISKVIPAFVKWLKPGVIKISLWGKRMVSQAYIWLIGRPFFMRNKWAAVVLLTIAVLIVLLVIGYLMTLAFVPVLTILTLWALAIVLSDSKKSH